MIFAPRLAAAVEELDPTLEELPPEVKPLRTQMSVISSLMGVVSFVNPTRSRCASYGDINGDKSVRIQIQTDVGDGNHAPH